ncbi:MAG: hypothetical protein Q9220_006166 [cf. Caloplaca sp. 1 TL-2023]
MDNPGRAHGLAGAAGLRNLIRSEGPATDDLSKRFLKTSTERGESPARVDDDCDPTSDTDSSRDGKEAVSLQIIAALGALLLYSIAQVIYNLYFHPLSHFPGPKLWAASRLPFIYCLLTGTLTKRVREFHEKYGDFLRLAPDEVSFASEEAWEQIYSFRRGHKRALRDKALYIAPNDQADNLITTSDKKFHARVRGIMSRSFTNVSLCIQHPIIMRYADMLVSQLFRRAIAPHCQFTGARVNLTDRLNFFTMDVIGDLAFGESFHCLETSEYHTWIHELFSYLKGMSLAAALRYYPMAEFFFNKLIPKRVIEDQKRHTQYANERINRRLDSKMNRPDFITPLMRDNANFVHISRDEILSTFNSIIVGGSEATATTLTGIFNHLSKNRQVLDRLCGEIRNKYSLEQDITIDSTTHGLPYLEAVLNEGLRMCNPIPRGLPRVVPEGGDTYCEVFIPGGTRLANRTFAVNRSTRYFTNPDQFVPECWLSPPERPTEHENDRLVASQPFSVGFHRCLGQPLAWVELRLVVIKLLWAFDLKEDGPNVVYFDEFPVIMSIQKKPMMMWLKVRPGVEYKRSHYIPKGR